MGTVIRVDFRKERQKEENAFRAFEEAMRQYDRRQKMKTIALTIGFVVALSGAVAVPFVFDALGLMVK